MKSKRVVEGEYFQWLSSLVNPVRGDTTYYLLLKQLHHKYFEWYVPNDDNRAYEGKTLRETYARELDDSRIYYFLEDMPISMLELIIGLAYRCNEIMLDQEVEKDMNEWFWELVNNANLTDFSDDTYYESGGSVGIDAILDKIIKRMYKRDGSGGLFPLKTKCKDQRKVELWYQMNTYLSENYYFEGVNL